MQAKLEEEERLANQKEEEDNIALIESWDNTQAMMDVDYELDARLQEEERGKLTIEEKSRFFVELMDKKRNILQDLELKRSKWIESFVPMDTELKKGSEKAAEGSSKREACKLEQEDAKRHRIKEENTSVKLKRCLEIIPDGDDDVTIEATSLSSKSLKIIDYKIYKEGSKRFFQIIREDGRLNKIMLILECSLIRALEATSKKAKL
nr:hypothetical protein [Tanacetum cinerariifolium]